MRDRAGCMDAGAGNEGQGWVYGRRGWVTIMALLRGACFVNK